MNNLGVVLGKNSQYQEAESILKKVITALPKLPDSYNNLGAILIIQEKFDTSMVYATTRKETIEFKVPPVLR